MNKLSIRPAQAADVGAILGMIHELADYEKMRHLCSGTEAMLAEALFGAQPSCECLVGWVEEKPIAFALFYHNYSTFLGKKGLYLEDIYVKPDFRGTGYGREILVSLARIAMERQCGRFEWAVLDWNAEAIDFYAGLGGVMLPDWRICRVMGAELEHLAR